MEMQIQDLVSAIKKEGIETAQEEAEKIINEAKKRLFVLVLILLQMVVDSLIFVLLRIQSSILTLMAVELNLKMFLIPLKSNNI